jgi:hypothetical protein
LSLFVESFPGLNTGFKYKVPTCIVTTTAKNIFPALILDVQGDVICLHGLPRSLVDWSFENELITYRPREIINPDGAY